jgi:hypothetical protein
MVRGRCSPVSRALPWRCPPAQPDHSLATPCDTTLARKQVGPSASPLWVDAATFPFSRTNSLPTNSLCADVCADPPSLDRMAPPLFMATRLSPCSFHCAGLQELGARVRMEARSKLKGGAGKARTERSVSAEPRARVTSKASPASHSLPGNSARLLACLRRASPRDALASGPSVSPPCELRAL